MDGTAGTGRAVSNRPLEEYLRRPLSPVDETVREAIAAGPIDPARALPLDRLAAMLDRSPLPAETGWCTLADGVGFVAVRTEMPDVSGEMIDWWFDWHPRESLRYRVWHPAAHRANSLDPRASFTDTARPGAKAHWGAVHHPVEDVGVGVVRARITFWRPSEIGFADDLLEHADVATVVCGFVGDDRRRMRHTPLVHVFLREGDGVVLRSGFWLGAALRPFGVLGAPGERLLNNRIVRRVTLPAELPHALATHCSEEFANLATLLPELYTRFGPGAP
jgi:hypothetical protein